MSVRRISAWLGLLACALATIVSARALEARAPERGPAKELLYLPNGRYLRLASLGQEPLMADLMYLWAIQFYSNYERADRYRYVRHVFADVITELDPHYIDAYWLGAMILTVEARDLEGGLALLDLGFERNPDQWVLPYLAAWECYNARQPERASAYFERAARVPGAPLLTRRMHASLLARHGELDTALEQWEEVLAEAGADAASRGIATRKIRELRAQIELRNLRGAVERFRSDHGRFPTRLEELVRAGYIPAVPRGPDGRAYAYDRRSGAIASATSRVLGKS